MKKDMSPGAISRDKIAPGCSLSRFVTAALFTANLIAGTSIGMAANPDRPRVATVTVGLNPNGLAVTSNGGAVYVANSGSNIVSVINAATNSVVATIAVGNTPMFVAITPDGTTAFVTNNKDNTVSVISTATNSVTDTLKVGLAPWGLAVKPDGSDLWICNRGTGNNDGTVSNIDVATHKTVRTIPIPVGQSPLYVLFSPDGLKAHVLNQGDLAPKGTHVQGYLTQLDAAKGRIIGERTFTQDNTAPLGMALDDNNVQEIYISCLPAESMLVKIGNLPTVCLNVFRGGPGFRNPGSYLGGPASSVDPYRRRPERHRWLFIADTGENKLVRSVEHKFAKREERAHSVHLGDQNKPLYVALSLVSDFVYLTNPSSGTVSVIDNTDIKGSLNIK